MRQTERIKSLSLHFVLVLKTLEFLYLKFVVCLLYKPFIHYRKIFLMKIFKVALENIILDIFFHIY